MLVEVGGHSGQEGAAGKNDTMVIEYFTFEKRINAFSCSLATQRLEHLLLLSATKAIVTGSPEIAVQFKDFKERSAPKVIAFDPVGVLQAVELMMVHGCYTDENRKFYGRELMAIAKAAALKISEEPQKFLADEMDRDDFFRLCSVYGTCEYYINMHPDASDQILKAVERVVAGGDVQPGSHTPEP